MKKNIIIGVLALISLGSVGYIAYDKINSKESDNNNLIESNSDKLYADYLKKLKEKNTDITISNYNDNRSTGYSFTINKEGELLLTASVNRKNKYKDHKISDNVLMMFLNDLGNGGYKSLDFIKEDGSINSFCVDCYIENEDTQINTLNYKNIVNVVTTIISDGFSGGYTSLYIDIDGNAFTVKNDDVKQLTYTSSDTTAIYNVTLNKSGKVSISTNNETNNLEIENVKDIISFSSEPGYLPGQYCYMLTTNGEVYSYVIGNALSNNYKVEKFKDVKNITEIKVEPFSDGAENAGACSRAVAISKDGTKTKLKGYCA